MNNPLNIVSPDGRYSAALTEVKDGIEVRLYHRVGRANGHADKLVKTDTFDAPFHVVCDIIHDMLRQEEI